MPESFVTNIAGGDTTQNKIALTLNRAGDSPHNPILKGLGMNVDIKLSPNVVSFQASYGLNTPAEDRILADLEQVGFQHFRLNGVAGEGQLGFDVSYVDSVRHFLRLELMSASYLVGDEKETWFREDPEIELFFCAGGLVWCCDAANAYFSVGEDQGEFGLFTDPGEPPQESLTPVEPPPLEGSFFDDTVWAASAGPFKESSSPTAANKVVRITGEGSFTPGPDTFAGLFSMDFEAYHPITLRKVRVRATSESWTGSGSYDAVTGEFAGTGAVVFSFTPTWEYIDGGPAGGGAAFIITSAGEFQSEQAEYDGQKFCDGPLPGDTGVANTQLVPVGPEKIVSLFVNDLVVDPQQPISLPLRIMDRWRDEFDQKHYGGTKYLSIFEEGLAEDTQGSLIDSVYQLPIENVTALDVISVDPDTEYRLIFRFRSEQDDANYVDKLVRLRLFRSEDLRNQFNDNMPLDDFPVPVYDEDAAEWKWSGMDAFVADFGVFGATVLVDQTLVDLPLDDATAFPGDWADIRAQSYGGEVVVRFTRNYSLSNFAWEQTRCTYRIERPNGPDASPVTVSKVMRRRDIGSRAQSFAPDVQFRVIEPDGPTGAVYLEPLVNQIDFKQVLVWTSEGSLSLPMPLRSGQRYDITDIVTPGGDGNLQEDLITILTQTENSIRVLEINPQSARPRTEQKTIGVQDIDVTMEVDWPDLVITWPIADEGGTVYDILGPEDLSGPSYTVWGPKGIKRIEGFSVGTSEVIANAADEIMYIDSARFFASYRTDQALGGADHVKEFPRFPSVETIPPTGVVDNDDIGLIYYDNKLVLTKRPVNLISIDVTGSGGTKTVYSVELLTYAWLDLSVWTQGDPTISISYTYYDSATEMNVTEGPFVVSEFIPLPYTQAVETSNNPAAWNTGRLLETDAEMPLARINQIEKTIEFDYRDRFQRWIKWAAINPMDRTILSFAGTPPIRTLVDIQRLFRDDSPFDLQNKQSVLVIFLHQDGPHVPALYKISGEFEEPVQLNNLRGLL